MSGESTQSTNSLSNLLIVYGTGDGQTRKIAERIAEIARSQYSHVDTVNVSDITADFSPVKYNAIIIGSSMRHRKYDPAVIRFINDNKSTLDKCPSAFYSVRYNTWPLTLTISIGDATTINHWITEKVNQLLDQADWHPKTIGRFGGALMYTKYDFWMKFSFVIAGWFAKYPTDTSQDHELTKWEDVEKFTKEFLQHF